jgi:hypothetical protein
MIGSDQLTEVMEQAEGYAWRKVHRAQDELEAAQDLPR